MARPSIPRGGSTDTLVCLARGPRCKGSVATALHPPLPFPTCALSSHVTCPRSHAPPPPPSSPSSPPRRKPSPSARRSSNVPPAARSCAAGSTRAWWGGAPGGCWTPPPRRPRPPPRSSPPSRTTAGRRTGPRCRRGASSRAPRTSPSRTPWCKCMCPHHHPCCCTAVAHDPFSYEKNLHRTQQERTHLLPHPTPDTSSSTNAPTSPANPRRRAQPAPRPAAGVSRGGRSTQSARGRSAGGVSELVGHGHRARGGRSCPEAV
jgi:hypothetical protein